MASHCSGSTGTSAFSQLPFADRMRELADRFNIDIMGRASQIASAASGFFLNAVSGAVKNVAHFFLTLAMSIFILFFIYRDGEYIVDATVRRFRPIVLTALAAVLAMIPLSRSVFFGPMAVAIMGGLIVATALTLLFLPALYAAWFRIPAPAPAPRY